MDSTSFRSIWQGEGQELNSVVNSISSLMPEITSNQNRYVVSSFNIPIEKQLNFIPFPFQDLYNQPAPQEQFLPYSEDPVIDITPIGIIIEKFKFSNGG